LTLLQPPLSPGTSYVAGATCFVVCDLCSHWGCTLKGLHMALLNKDFPIFILQGVPQVCNGPCMWPLVNFLHTLFLLSFALLAYCSSSAILGALWRSHLLLKAIFSPVSSNSDF
jgi:hypothetical protein